MRHGIGVSPGVAVGTAYCIHQVYVDPAKQKLDREDISSELARFEWARDQVIRQLRAMRSKVSVQVGPEEAAIFQVHEAILHDPAFNAKIRTAIIDEQMPTPAALHQLLNDYKSLFARTKDEYLRERLSDVRDVVLRLSEHLSDVLKPEHPALTGPLVLVADELLPSQVMLLDRRDMVGIVTQSGGRTSHAAILARSRGLPAVSGIGGLLRQVNNGDKIVVDGRTGHVWINPDSETESAYLKLQREFVHLKDQLAENRNQPALTADGISVELLANINHRDDAQAAGAMGASGVGLYRTEYLFITHDELPSETEQYEDYLAVIQNSPGHRIAIRTLDLGGDKTVPYFGNYREANPFMGWRSIRLSFEHPELFSTQIRAILRAGADSGDPSRVRIMFPMITTLEEMRRVRQTVRRIQRDLHKRGVDAQDMPIGLMLEVPAAAVAIDALLEVSDFVSIGSNDLVQYLMAADRDNPKVSHLCQPLSPPVLRVLTNVIRHCNDVGKPVTLCGEMAGSPRSFVLLFGMGLRSFSMSPAFIPSIKDLVTHLTQARAKKIVDHALRLKTTAQINRYLGQQIADIAPNLEMLDLA